MRAFLVRVWLATVCFFRILFDPPFAAKVSALRAPSAPPPPAKGFPTMPSIPSAIGAAKLLRNEQALHLLSMLQREGHLLDFCEEDLAVFANEEIAAAARSVHAGCRKVLRDAFVLQPVRSEREGAAVRLPAGFDPHAVRLTGNVVGSPPFAGVLRHHGWRVAEVRMRSASSDPTLLAPAEVELP